MPRHRHVVIDQLPREITSVCVRAVSARLGREISTRAVVLTDDDWPGRFFDFRLGNTQGRAFLVSVLLPVHDPRRREVTVEWILDTVGNHPPTRIEVQEMRHRGFALTKLIFDCEGMNLATAHFSYCFGEANPEACRRYVAEPSDAGAVPATTIDGVARPARSD